MKGKETKSKNMNNDWRDATPRDLIDILTVGAEKGGVAKTTTVAAIGSGMSHIGFMPLHIDFDPQCNLTHLLSTEDDDEIDANKSKYPTVYDLIMGKCALEEAIQPSIDTKEQGWFIAGDRRLGAFYNDWRFLKMSQESGHSLLKDALVPLASLKRFDFALTDTPPLPENPFTDSAVRASTGTLIPVGPDVFGYQNLYNFVDFIQNSNPNIVIKALILTRYKEGARSPRFVHEISDVVKNAADALQTRFFTVRDTIRVSEAHGEKKSLFRHAYGCTAAADYLKIIYEITGIPAPEREW